MDLHQIWFRDPLADVINCAKFCRSRFTGFDSVGVKGRNLPLTWPDAVNTVLAVPLVICIVTFQFSALLKY